MNYEGLSHIGYGMYLVSASGKEPGRGNALLAILVMQVSSDPATLCVCMGKENYTHELIKAGGKFNISVLSRKADMQFLSRFGYKGGRDGDKMAGVECRDFGGIPTVVEDCNAVMECQVVNEVDCGKSTVFFGKLLDSKAIVPDPSMSYDHYQKVMKGELPKTAPAFVARYTK